MFQPAATTRMLTPPCESWRAELRGLAPLLLRVGAPLDARQAALSRQLGAIDLTREFGSVSDEGSPACTQRRTCCSFRRDGKDSVGRPSKHSRAGPRPWSPLSAGPSWTSWEMQRSRHPRKMCQPCNAVKRIAREPSARAALVERGGPRGLRSPRREPSRRMRMSTREIGQRSGAGVRGRPGAGQHAPSVSRGDCRSRCASPCQGLTANRALVKIHIHTTSGSN